MGILDGLMFNPQSYGGQSGGLLDMLRSLQMQQQYQPSAGFGDAALPANAQPTQGGPDRTIPVGDYQMPQFGNPMPQAPMQANAQMQPPQQAPSPDLGGRLSAGLEGFTSGPGMLSKLAGLAQGLSTGQSPVNQTQQALIQRGLEPALAQQVARNPELLRAVLPQLMGTTGQTDDIKEYQFAKRENPSLTFEKFMQQKKAVSGEYSLTPQYGTNEKGETVLIQTGKSGEAIQTKLPAGVKVSSGVEKIDLGTEWGLYDRRTGQLVGKQAKDLAGAASQREQGEFAGKAIAAAPADIQAGQNALDLLEKIEKHPYRERGTGFSSLANAIPGTGGFDFNNAVEQAKSGAFLTAVQQMRGLGSLSNAEGGAATAAITRMNAAASEEAFVDALNDYKKIIKQGIAKAQERLKAGGVAQPAPTPAPASAPQSGVVDYRTYFGGK